MRRDHIYLIGGIMLVIAIFLVVFISLSNAKAPESRTVGTFDMEEYQWYLEHFSVDIHVGEVNDADTAIAKARSLWSEEYGGDFPVEKIKVAYNAAEECWLIRYKENPHALGGAQAALIKKNGEVLAIWFED